jgi:class 3 adenylate cyclase/YHS domain-containing protein
MGDGRTSELSLVELARRSGEAAKHLMEWRSLHLIGAEDREGFSLEDLERIRLIQFGVRRGASVESFARAEAEGRRFLGHYIDQLFPAGIGPAYSIADAAEMAGLDVELVRRLQEVAGVSTSSGERVDKEDVELLRGWKIALEAGLPEEALFQLMRVYADALGRVAEAEARLFHFYVHERLRDGGLSGLALHDRTEAASQPMRRLIEPALLYFHRKGMAHALCEDMLLHLAEYSGSAERREAPAQLRVAIAFLDLASFTPLTESMGDVAAAEVVARFSELVREVVNRHQGRVVERIGDAFLLTFTEPQTAVACALEIERRAREEHQFPALRGGIHFGPVLYREGGYVGTNVNIAARVAAEAQRNQLLVTREVRAKATALATVDFVPLGRRRLKGLAEELELFEACVLGEEGTKRVTDPVCGMELTKVGVAARLSLEDSEVSFCSERCLRIFVESRSR